MQSTSSTADGQQASAERPPLSVRYASLESRGVFITGGASGIGAEMVRRFVSQGSKVTFVDIDDEAAERVVAETGAEYVHCDLTDIPTVRKVILAADDKYPISVLINNAARDDRHSVESVEPETWRRTLALNLDHQFFCTQAIAPRMQARGAGSIILFGSVAWMRGKTGLVGYTTSKAALEGLTRTLAREFGEKGVRVNCIVPGAILTERQAKLWRTPELNAHIQVSQALKISLVPWHVASMALFLASDESSGCTGQNFIVDAGITIN
jgi:NAD(P)-dependent dehydrogenase (short-subunit alcohol dehydrogenase family)